MPLILCILHNPGDEWLQPTPTTVDVHEAAHTIANSTRKFGGAKEVVALRNLLVRVLRPNDINPHQGLLILS